jgi:hypothetical protein
MVPIFANGGYTRIAVNLFSWITFLSCIEIGTLKGNGEKVKARAGCILNFDGK